MDILGKAEEITSGKYAVAHREACCMKLTIRFYASNSRAQLVLFKDGSAGYTRYSFEKCYASHASDVIAFREYIEFINEA